MPPVKTGLEILDRLGIVWEADKPRKAWPVEQLIDFAQETVVDAIEFISMRIRDAGMLDASLAPTYFLIDPAGDVHPIMVGLGHPADVSAVLQTQFFPAWVITSDSYTVDYGPELQLVRGSMTDQQMREYANRQPRPSEHPNRREAINAALVHMPTNFAGSIVHLYQRTPRGLIPQEVHALTRADGAESPWMFGSQSALH